MKSPVQRLTRSVFCKHWIICILLMVLLLCIGSRVCLAQSSSADEYEIRAAMLFNLTRFIEWPPSKMDQSHPEFLICILGSDPLGMTIDNLMRNKSVGTKPVIVRHLSSAEAANDCHILYVGAGERKNLMRASAELARNRVLTVSERSTSDSPDQVIGLPTIEDHVHIDVNLGVAQRSGLTISSKLLHLATVSR